MNRIAFALAAACACTVAFAAGSATPQAVERPSGAGPTASRQPAAAPGRFRLVRIARALREPLYLTAAAAEPDRLYVVLKGGVVRVLARGRLEPRPFLDLGKDVLTYGEMGLLSIAFHPAYPSQPLVYAAYNDSRRAVRIVEYRVTDGRADPKSARLLVRVPHADSIYHNGGQLVFGPDGKLYAGVGDGGYTTEANGQLRPDPRGNSENLKVLLGKIFRLDVAEPESKPELVAYGLRNPWRFSFHPASGDLIIGDVGWDKVEEIDLVPRGSRVLNFGWSVYEGVAQRRTAVRLNPAGKLTRPLLTYRTRTPGNCAITGGYVYRGSAVPSLRGRYVYGDYCSGRIWTVRIERGKASSPTLARARVRGLASFGEDARGELYAVSLDGDVYRLVE